MGIKVSCNCDICGKDMQVPLDGAAEYRPVDIQLRNQGCREFVFKFACDTCLNTLRNLVDNMRASALDTNDNIRAECFKAYHGIGDRNEKRFISAIKVCRQITGLCLKESKDLCEKWRDQYGWENNK